MWTCEKCDEEMEDTFDACWKCSSNKLTSEKEEATELTSEKEEATELTSEKKTNWSVNKKYYYATVLGVTILCYLVLFLYLLNSNYYTRVLKAVPQYSIPVSIFLIYITEYQSTELKEQTIKAIITTLIITILVFAFLEKFWFSLNPLFR